MAITKFDKPICRVIGDEVAKALQAIADKHGLTVAPAGGVLSENGMRFTCKVEFNVTDPEATLATERVAFGQWCGLYNLKPNDYGSIFTNKGSKYELIGFAVGRGKAPIKARLVGSGTDSRAGVYLFPQGVLTLPRTPAA